MSDEHLTLCHMYYTDDWLMNKSFLVSRTSQESVFPSDDAKDVSSAIWNL